MKRNEIFVEYIRNELHLERLEYAISGYNQLQEAGIGIEFGLPSISGEIKLEEIDLFVAQVRQKPEIEQLPLREQERFLRLRQAALRQLIFSDPELEVLARANNGWAIIIAPYEGQDVRVQLHLPAGKWDGRVQLNERPYMRHAHVRFVNGQFILVNDSGEQVATLEHKVVLGYKAGLPELKLAVWLPWPTPTYYFSSYIGAHPEYGNIVKVVAHGLPVQDVSVEDRRRVTRARWLFKNSLGEVVKAELPCEFEFTGQLHIELWAKARAIWKSASQRWASHKGKASWWRRMFDQQGLWQEFVDQVIATPEGQACRSLGEAYGKEWQRELWLMANSMKSYIEGEEMSLV